SRSTSRRSRRRWRREPVFQGPARALGPVCAGLLLVVAAARAPAESTAAVRPREERLRRRTRPYYDPAMLRRAAPAAFLVSLLLIAVQAAAAQAPGELDLDFSTPDGRLMTNFTSGFDSATEALVQSDNKV